MKSFLKRVLRRLLRPVLAEIELELGRKLVDDEAVTQKALVQHYRTLARLRPECLPLLSDAGFRKYSQFEEDGILLLLFSLIEPQTRTCVEICAGSGRECMSTNLILNHGWWGHLFDGNTGNVETGRRFFARHKDTFLHPPRFTHAWITAENVNEVIGTSGASGPVDLLSLDIDGMDYWVWKAITVIQPTVVVCEIHNPIPPDLALTVPYDPRFVADDEDYRGASLLAMTKLAENKGYRLVGTHRYGFNAFFVRRGVEEAILPEVTPESCANDPYTRLAQQTRWPRVRDREWVAV